MDFVKRLVTIGLVAVSVLAVGPAPGQIKNLVTFGDSYTDVVLVSDGGTPWPVYASRYGNFNLYPYARSGGACSTAITPYTGPSVFESQLPLYYARVKNGTLKLKPNETIYTLWIGTNDVGTHGLLTGHQVKGKTIVDTSLCAVNWIKSLYASGARNFLFQNMVPLQFTPLYSAKSYPNRYYTTPRNTTEWNLFMAELVTSGNVIARLLLKDLPATLPGAHIGLFNSFQLFADMYNHPGSYLNGTAPLNVTGAVRSCVYKLNQNNKEPGTCTIATGTARDSFLWQDELHPSEQAARIVARELTKGIQRKSDQWTLWFS